MIVMEAANEPLIAKAGQSLRLLLALVIATTPTFYPLPMTQS